MEYSDLTCNICGESDRIIPSRHEAWCEACGARGIVNEVTIRGSQTIAGKTTWSNDVELHVMLNPPIEGKRVFRSMGIGDVIFALPLIRTLKQQGERVVFVGPPTVWPLISEQVDGCIPHGNIRPDDIDLNGCLDSAAELGAPSRPLGYARKAGVELDNPKYVIMLTLEAEEHRKQYRSEAEKRITVAAYSSTGDRSLPTLEELEIDGYTVSLCHSGVRPPYGDLHQMLGLLAASDLVISVDSGPLYAASALGIPVIGFYTRVWPPRLWPQDQWTAVWCNHEDIQPLDLDWVAEQAVRRLEGDAHCAEMWSTRTDEPELRAFRGAECK